jgi:hypothetical protein
MQVFMPDPSIPLSPTYLDTKRLGNQIWREAKTLISGGWPNHPAAKIWRDYRGALARYCLAGLHELRHNRGRPYPRWEEFFVEILWDEMRKENVDHADNLPRPPIIGYAPYHAAMRSQLLTKDPEWYGQFGWTEEPGALTYVWRLPE